MATKASGALRTVYGKAEDRYLELIRQFPLRPLRRADDLDAAISVADALLDRDVLSPPEQDYLDVLGDLIEAYEDEAVPIPAVSDADLLRFLIEQKGVTQAAAAKATAIVESTISAVLAGKRSLTRRQIGRLAKFFHVETSVFLGANID